MSLAIRVELLSERYVATRFDDRNQPEWPPQPARLFSAMVAAWATNTPPEPCERDALVWLEAQGPPAMACSRPEEVGTRTSVVQYVPNNQPSDPKDGGLLTLIPERRGRQPRTFPTVVPADPQMWFLWPNAEPGFKRLGDLDQVLSRIGRLGHSSSLVSCRLDDHPPDPGLLPNPNGPLALRVPAPGLLDLLEEAFEHHLGCEPRTLPAATAHYSWFSPKAPDIPLPALAGHRFLLRIRQRDLPIWRSQELARAVHGALQTYANQPIPEVLSGHQTGPPGIKTGASQRAHAAVVPLPFVGRIHATGVLQGVAILLPTHINPEERMAVAGAIGRWRQASRSAGTDEEPTDDEGPACLARLQKGRVLKLDPVDDLEVSWSLRERTWSRSASQWATATPIVLDRFPRGLLDRHRPDRQAVAEAQAIDTITRACEHIGLPRPAQVAVLTDPPLHGSAPAGAFPPYATRDRPARLAVHARIGFDLPVRGPLLLGAGRYLGQGLCLPLGDDGGR
ncbi:MAG: type I-G CRISPR-associated protein Csb2 [Acidimicrobiales bacterium]